MRVHITLWNDNHILPRMAGWLEEHNGWTIGDKPDPSADVNYYMPYLMWTEEAHPDTLTTGWFTHYEEGTKSKMQIWHDAATFIDMPLVTSPIYYASLEKSRLVTPGVERDRYTPVKRKANDKPRLGIAGIGQPRKGPYLIVDLYYSGIEARVDLVGTNWPFPHVIVGNQNMPDWYRNLDVYVCTSSIEGIPAPVLEALATDVKVVIPDGVGICDQLPEMEGLRHYRKNDGPDMIRAIKQALDDKPSEGSLRDVTADYTVDDWCYSHRRAMEALLDADLSV